MSLLGPAIERAWPSSVRSTLLWKPLTPRTAAVGLLLQRTEVELNKSGCVGVFAFIERSLVPFFFTSVP